MAALSLVFDLIGKDVSASKAFNDVGDAADRAGKKGEGFGSSVGKGMGIAVGAIAAAGIGTMFTGFIKDAAESAKIGRLTEAVLKSTGGAAKITAGQVSELATAISNKTAVDDETIQSAENLLLTFTKVRNETGKGNDIFNQATQAAVDMSVAMGTDANGAALQLGKALNDPIKGVTALSKAGVSFTQQQKDQIKAMVAAGDTLGAQKIILSEMQTQFGGAAAAAADPLERLKVIAGNLGEDIGGKLLPYVERFSTYAVDTLLPNLTNLGGYLGDKLGPIFGTVKDAIGGVYDLIANGNFSGQLASAFNISEDNPVVDWVLTARESVLHIWDGVTGFWDGLDLSGITTRVTDAVKDVGGPLIAGLTTGIQTGNWSGLGLALVGAVGTALGAIGTLAGKAYGAFKDLMSKVDWVGVGSEVGKQVPTILAGLAIGLLNFDLMGLLGGLADHWFEALMAVLAIALMPVKVIGKLGEILAKVPLVGTFLQWGLNGIKGLTDNIVGWVGDVVSGFVRGFLGEGVRIGAAFRSIFDDIALRLLVWGDNVVAWFRGIPGKFVQIAEALGSQLRAKFDEIVTYLGAIVRGGVESIANFFRPVTDRLASIAQTAWDWVVGKFNGMKNAVVGIFTSIRDTVGTVWDGLLNKVRAPIRVVFDFVNGSMISPINSLLGKFPGGLQVPFLPRLASGGLLRGPGTGTSDSILGIDPRTGIPTAHVSTGEFVVNAAATRRNRDLLESINAGYYAKGGEVGGPLDFIGDLLAKGARKAAELIVNPLRNTAKGLIPGGNVIGDVVRGFVDKLADSVLGKGSDADKAGASGPIGGGPAGSGWQALWAKVHAAFPSARMTSNYRPGDPGYHGKGKAVDVAGARPGDAGAMSAINRWAAATMGANLSQLIYTPGINLLNGKPHTYNAATRADHYDHVHLASYQTGTNYVPVTAPALLHKGEAVLTAAENAARGGPMQVTLQLDRAAVTDLLDGRIVTTLSGVINRGGYNPS